MVRAAIYSRLRRALAGLALVSAVVVAPCAEAGVHTVTIGQNGDLNWRGEGAAAVDVLPARHRLVLDPNRIVVGNAPGQRVELDSGSFPGSLHPLETTGTDIAHGMIERGGDISWMGWTRGQQYHWQEMQLRNNRGEILWRESGDETKAAEIPEGMFGLRFFLDLGGRFGVKLIRFYPRNSFRPAPTTPFQDRFLTAFQLLANDGVLLTEHGGPKYQLLAEESNNENPVVEIAVDPPRILEHLQLVAMTGLPWEIDEIEIVGEGFVPDGRYVSNIFDAGEAAAWTSLRWTEDAVHLPELSKMEIRTRTGTDDSPFVFHRRLQKKPDAEEIPFAIDSDSQELTQQDYDNLPKRDSQGLSWARGGVDDDLVGWSPFSAPYPAEAATGEGIPIFSPSPRRYFQFQVSFEGSDLKASRLLNALSFSYTLPAMADSLRAEIYPRVADVSATGEYTYSVLAVIRSPGLSGFDGMEISTPSRVEGIDSVELLNGREERLAFRAFTGLDDTTLVDGFRIVSVEDDRFALQFPQVRETQTRVDVRFRSPVFTYSTDFPARVTLQSEEEAFQAVESGDAGFLGPGDDAASSGTTVLSSQLLGGGRLLDSVEVQPNPFTPNGDGVNDELSVRYDLVSVTAAIPVSIRVYDLSGRMLTAISESVERSGRYEESWDGRDAQGRLLAPGLYLLRIEADGDAENARQARVVSLVY